MPRGSQVDATSSLSLVELLSAIQRLGIRLSLDEEDALSVHAPTSALTPQLRAALAAHKIDLLPLLRRQRIDAGPSTRLVTSADDADPMRSLPEQLAPGMAHADMDERAGFLPPVLANYISSAPAAAGDEPSSSDHLRGVFYEEGSATLLAVVIDQAAGILELRPDDILPDASLLDRGFNSLMAVELSDRLWAALGVRLPVAAIWQDLRPIAIADQLVVARRLAGMTFQQR